MPAYNSQFRGPNGAGVVHAVTQADVQQIEDSARQKTNAQNAQRGYGVLVASDWSQVAFLLATWARNYGGQNLNQI